MVEHQDGVRAAVRAGAKVSGVWRVTRGCLLLCLACVLLHACAKPPNVLLVSLDTLRPDHLGAYGYARDTSPFLDRLAARGVLFRNAFVNCLPTPASHTTMLSSWYQETHLMYRAPNTAQDIRLIPDAVPLVQETLGRSGYVTVGVTGGGYVAGQIGFRRGFDEFDDRSGNVVEGARRLARLIGKHSRRRRPVFAFFHTYEIHAPYRVPEKYKALFGSHEVDFDISGEYLGELGLRADTLRAEELAYIEAMYDRGIRFTDDVMGSLFAELVRNG